jgi:hypothetical protein
MASPSVSKLGKNLKPFKSVYNFPRPSGAGPGGRINPPDLDLAELAEEERDGLSDPAEWVSAGREPLLVGQKR